MLLTTLPYHVFSEHIIPKLEVRDLVRFCRTCSKMLARIMHDFRIWKVMQAKTFEGLNRFVGSDYNKPKLYCISHIQHTYCIDRFIQFMKYSLSYFKIYSDNLKSVCANI